jgi:omega-6 fatty acid desaturase (delta-12 desaturase)
LPTQEGERLAPVRKRGGERFKNPRYGQAVDGQERTLMRAGADAAPVEGGYSLRRPDLAAYAKPHVPRSLLDLATSVVPYLGLSVAMYWLLDVSYLLALFVAVPAGGFLLRTYILFHDCTHGSFLPTKRANLWVGRVLALIVYSPFSAWRHNHAVHHATSGDLDRRGVGDVPTWTVAEYNAATRPKRIGYWLFRHPLVMFVFGPIWAMVIGPRLVTRSQRPRIRRSVLWTNLGLILIAAAWCALIGWRDYLLVWAPPALLAGAAGVFLFYVQHQFEDAYWENGDGWSYADAALRGSSYLKLPVILQFFTGNIGLHHVHHLSTRIPNYRLERAHHDNPIFHGVPVLTLWDGVKAVRLKLWDEDSGRLVTFQHARRLRT